MKVLYNIISLIGRQACKYADYISNIIYFIFQSCKRIFTPKFQKTLIIQQMEFVGNRSLIIIILAGCMVGAVLGLQLGDVFKIFKAESIMGAAVLYTMCKEFAPIVTGFLVAGRAGSAMAAEIGNMRINEQIDAMIIMTVNPYNYIIAPRVVASILMMPLLTGIFILVGFFTAFFIGVIFYNIDVGLFFEKTKLIVSFKNLLEGLQKAIIFGGIISIISCYNGFYAKGGAKGVGQATTISVMLSFVSIIFADFIISYIQYHL